MGLFYIAGAPQQNQPNVPGAAPGAPTTGGQLAVPTGMNESQLQKAYAALGLPYQGSQFSNNPQQGHLPNNAVRMQSPHGAGKPLITGLDKQKCSA